MQARELLGHVRAIAKDQQLVDRYGGRLELTGLGCWIWRPPSVEAWQAFVNDSRPAYPAGLAEQGKDSAGPKPSAREEAPAEPEESPREQRRRLRLANRDKRIQWV
jgi:hypothetical protein